MFSFPCLVLHFIDSLSFPFEHHAALLAFVFHF